MGVGIRGSGSDPWSQKGCAWLRGEDSTLRAYPRGCVAVWQRCREWEQVLEGNYIASKTFTSDTR